MCIIAVPSQHGLRRYKLEIESTKTVLVDCHLAEQDTKVTQM